MDNEIPTEISERIDKFMAEYYDRVRVMIIEVHEGMAKTYVYLCTNIRSKDGSRDNIFVNCIPFGKFPFFTIEEIEHVAHVIDGPGVTEEDLKCFFEQIGCRGIVYIQQPDNCKSIQHATHGFAGNAYANALNIETIFRLKNVLLNLPGMFGTTKISLSYATKCVKIHQEKLKITKLGNLYTTQKVFTRQEEFGNEELFDGDTYSRYSFVNFHDGSEAILVDENNGRITSFSTSDVMFYDNMNDIKRASIAYYENKKRTQTK